MNLLTILNNQDNSVEISNHINERLQSKDFWKKDEENYKEIITEIEAQHKSIQMGYEKYNKVFNI